MKIKMEIVKSNSVPRMSYRIAPGAGRSTKQKPFNFVCMGGGRVGKDYTVKSEIWSSP